MKEEILSNLNDPIQLEKLYRRDRSAFRRAFDELGSGLEDNVLAAYWNARLHYEREDLTWGSRKDLGFVLVLVLVAGLIAKLPAFFSWEEEFYYSRNIGFILFPALAAWFARKQQMPLGKVLFMVAAMVTGLVFINLLPPDKGSDTLVLSCIHLVLFLWSTLGFAFVGGRTDNYNGRLAYLSYNGDLLVMTTLIVIAGGILTAVTIGLFTLIGLDIRNFYFENLVAFALPAAPILGTYLTQSNPQLVGKVSPVIARIFSPLVLVMLFIYLIAMVYSGRDPYNDREFLLVFNGLLVGVMAIIFFSVAEGSKTGISRAETWVLFLLSLFTILVNGIALSAILFRIAEWGITPNRAAVLGGNLLILVNLVLVTWRLSQVVTRKTELGSVGWVISKYLPVYAIWTMVVAFLFPFIFGFK